MTDYDSLSEEELLKEIEKHPWTIVWIDNPTEEVQLAAVKKGALSIRLITNPSEKVQLVALKYKWKKEFYNVFIKDLPNKTEWFHREFNRLKVVKGPLK